MLDKKNIISTMITQHRALQKELGAIAEILGGSEPDAEKISQGLVQFKGDLMEHLDLENNTFYKELLKEMKEKGQNTDKTEQFIAEMDGIGKVVVEFLGKFASTQDIESKLDEFKSEFDNIVEVLTLRVESEESGVYAYWGLF